jgi:uncharacterized membrane protein
MVASKPKFVSHMGDISYGEHCFAHYSTLARFARGWLAYRVVSNLMAGKWNSMQAVLKPWAAVQQLQYCSD